ncbi:MAG: toxin-activating lysine-acyltransferase [Pseudomonadota bacterium]
MAKAPKSKKTQNAKGQKPSLQEADEGPFNHPTPQGASRTVAGVLGEITWLLTQSSAHKGFFISDIEWMIMVPVMLQQFRLFYDKDKPVGVVLWAKISEEVEDRLMAGNTRMRPQDWKSGETLWVVEIIAPFGGHDEMLKDFKAETFKDTPVHYLQRSAKGNEAKVI